MVGKDVFLMKKETRAGSKWEGKRIPNGWGINEKERRPFADRISGTVRRNLSRDLKFLVGI